MAIRARNLLVASLVAVPILAYTCPAFGHNGRDGAPPPLSAWSRGMAQAKAHAPPRDPAAQGQADAGKFIDIYEGIVVKVDPKTGVRSYVQVGDVPANPARARVAANTGGPGVDYWVNKEFERNQAAPAEPAYAYSEPAPQISNYDEYPYGYGGYLPGYGYGGGGGFGRPGHGGGSDGRPGHGGDGGGGGQTPPPRTGGGIISQPYRPSAPAGPYGGGVGSPPPYNDRGVGAPPPVSGYGGFRPSRG